MFTSALNTSRIIDAFRLCSLNDTASVKKGEQMLKEMRKDPSYIIMLSQYLTNKEAGLQDHIRAALQIEKTIDEILNDFQVDRTEEISEEIQKTLLSIYIICQQPVANILRTVISTCGLTQDLIKYLASMDNGSYLVKIRTLKLYSKQFKELEDQTILQFSDHLALYVLGELQAGVNPGPRNQPLPTALLYQMVKIIVLYTQNFSTPFEEKNLVVRIIQVMKKVLNLPIDQQHSKKQFKMKGKAFNCLTFLINVTSDDSKEIIDHFNYIVSVKKSSPDLAEICLDYYLNFLKGTIEHLKQTQKQPALKEILETAILMCYNPEHMYKALKQDHDYFIQVYFECLSEDNGNSLCRKVFRTFIKRYPSLWVQMLQTGKKGGNPTELLMCFICESALVCSSVGVLKHPLKNEDLESILSQVFEKNIKPLNIQHCPAKLYWSEELLLKVVCSLRILFYYRNYIRMEQIKNIIFFCSKLAIKNSTLQFMCYYIIRKFLQIMNEYHIQGNADSQHLYLFDDRIPELCDILHVIFQDANTNLFAMTMQDMTFVSRAVDILFHKKIFHKFQKPLKQLSIAVLCLCQNGGDEQTLDRILSIPSDYSLYVRYEPQFTKPLLKLIQKKIVNNNVATLYIDYMQTGADDPKSVAQMFKQMSSPEFWFDNKDFGYLYIPVLIILTSKNDNYIESMSKTLTIANDVVEHMCKTGNYQKAQMIGLLIMTNALPHCQLHKKLQQLYLVLFSSSRKAPNLTSLLISLMASYPHPKASTRFCCVDRLCYAFKRTELKESELQLLINIIFLHFEMYFDINQFDSWKKWGHLFEMILKYKMIKQNQKKKIVNIFHKFQEKYKPDVCKILKEKYQIMLTAWMFQFSSVT